MSYKSLRKGSSLVYFQYPNVGGDIYADRFEVELHNYVATLRFRIKPSDSNQKDDEEHLHEYSLQSVRLDDKYIINHLGNFLKNKSVSSMWLAPRKQYQLK